MDIFWLLAPCFFSLAMGRSLVVIYLVGPLAV
jgi:hypothetical protein